MKTGFCTQIRHTKKGLDMTRDKISNEKIIEVLDKNGGLLKPTAKALKIHRSTLYVWIYGSESKGLKGDPELEEAVKDARESMIDFAEGKLVKQIKKGDTTSIIFYLKTQGKERGYVERQEFAEHVEQPMFPEDEHDDTGEFNDEPTDNADGTA